jgi:sensor histidine kinase YesM
VILRMGLHFPVFVLILRLLVFSINLGALVAYTLVAYICQYGLAFLGGQDWGFFVGTWTNVQMTNMSSLPFIWLQDTVSQRLLSSSA